MNSGNTAYKLKINRGRLSQMGVHMMQDGLSIVSDIQGKKQCGIIIYPKTGKELKIPFSRQYLIGGLYCLLVKDFPYQEFFYLFYRDDELVTDPYAELLDSSERFGDSRRKGKPAKCIYRSTAYDWEEDRPLEIPFQNSIIYKLHMRGFTRHASAKVTGNGTFAGLIQKIPYLKDLGITAVESMPIHEFEDVIYNPSYARIDEAVLPFMDEKKQTWEHKVNYWGYCAGNYMAPKRAYSFSDRPDVECKDMIKALHKNGMEFIMQFYFPADARPGYILDVCRFWAIYYHVDGFKLMGCTLPVKLLSSDPYLKTTKLIFETLGEEKPDLTVENSCFKNLGAVLPGFAYDIRKYLKGDEDMLSVVAEHFKRNPGWYAAVNEITSYQGFTLADLVSYDRKHNEENGEENRDGNDYNYSWNCGVEGKTRKKSILSLRQQQSKSALIMLLLAQGTPVLLAGDEFGNSAGGNNNPYCQDNAVSWLDWKETAAKRELHAFVKQLIALRRAHPIFHMQEQLKQMDYLSCGYPDLSYHGDQAWYPGFENYNRHIGIMYCGKYAKIDRKTEDDFFYIAYNTHWIDHEFALPKLPSGMSWQLVLSSSREQPQISETVRPLAGKEIPRSEEKQKQNRILVKARTVVVLTGKRQQGK